MFLLAAYGLRFRMEDVQADGRADVVAEHSCAPYRGKWLPICLIGLGFDSKTRHLADCREMQIQ